MEYVTRGGYALEIGRIPRQIIDGFVASFPVPEPPTRTVEVWGEVEEEVPDYDDPDYQRALNRYWLEIGKQHITLIADAVTLPPNVDFGELSELFEIGLVSSRSESVADFLRYVVHDDDMQEIVYLVLYNSTVTDRGIWEAAQRYSVMWDKKKLSPFITPGKSKGGYGAEFEARLAARFSGKEWGQFCELPGREQSSLVAFYRLNNSLAWLQANEGKK